jgi:hypothetical protein
MAVVGAGGTSSTVAGMMVALIAFLFNSGWQQVWKPEPLSRHPHPA